MKWVVSHRPGIWWEAVLNYFCSMQSLCSSHGFLTHTRCFHPWVLTPSLCLECPASDDTSSMKPSLVLWGPDGGGEDFPVLRDPAALWSSHWWPWPLSALCHGCVPVSHPYLGSASQAQGVWLAFLRPTIPCMLHCMYQACNLCKINYLGHLVGSAVESPGF